MRAESKQRQRFLRIEKLSLDKKIDRDRQDTFGPAKVAIAPSAENSKGRCGAKAGDRFDGPLPVEVLIPCYVVIGNLGTAREPVGHLWRLLHTVGRGFRQVQESRPAVDVFIAD